MYDIQPPSGAPALVKLALGYGWQMGAVWADGTYSPEVNVGLAKRFFVNGMYLAKTMATARGSLDMWCWVKRGGGTTCEGTGGDVRPDPTMELDELVVGANFMCGRRPGGSVRCWGTFPGCATGKPEQSYWCDPQLPSPDHAHDVELLAPAAAVATNTALVRLACAVLVDGRVQCWGGFGFTCSNFADPDGGAQDCQAQEAEHPVIGPSVKIVTGTSGRVYGAWGTIDLGSHASP
jgi:hypothetical protein